MLQNQSNFYDLIRCYKLEMTKTIREQVYNKANDGMTLEEVKERIRRIIENEIEN